jgi:hypothetical protein
MCWHISAARRQRHRRGRREEHVEIRPQQDAPPVDGEVIERAKLIAHRLRLSDPEQRAAVKVFEFARSTFTSQPSWFALASAGGCRPPG